MRTDELSDGAPDLPTETANREASEFDNFPDGGWYANLEYPGSHIGLEAPDLLEAGWLIVDAYRFSEEAIVVRVEYGGPDCE